MATSPRRRSYYAILAGAMERYGIGWREAQAGWRTFTARLVAGGYRGDYARAVDLDLHPRIAADAFEPEEEEDFSDLEVEIAVDYVPAERR